MMDRAGFKILVPVKVSVDPQLPFMGYTMLEGGSFSIVVSGGLVECGRTGDRLRDRWENAGILVHNARAIAQMRRHKVEDVGNRAADRNKRFLAGSPPEYEDGFRMFRNKMIYLREEFTVKEFQVVLRE